MKKKTAVAGSARAMSTRRTRGLGASSVYDALRQEILSLEIQPGTLLDETDLAKRFQLSRSPVREALIRLSAEGLVLTLRNRSSIVAPFDVTAVPSYLDAVQLVYRLTTRLAALNRSEAQLNRIKQLQEQHAAAARRDDILEVIRLNQDFHLAIAAASGNSYYENWTRQVLDQGQRILRLYIYSIGDHVADNVLADHKNIVQAIQDRDPIAAEAAGKRDADIISSQMRERFAMRQSEGISLHSIR